jgi:hypothetical protein
MRLPVDSRIAITSDRDSTTVTETLKWRQGTIIAIIFAGIVLSVLSTDIVSDLMVWRRHPADGLTSPMVLSAFWLLEAALGVMVLDQICRQTMIRICDSEVTLVLSALVSPTRRYCWPVQQVGELHIVFTQSGPNVTALAELQFCPASDTSIHLFTDHREAEVRQIAGVISRALKGEHVV